MTGADLAVVRLDWTLDKRGETGMDIFRKEGVSAWRIIRYMAYEATLSALSAYSLGRSRIPGRSFSILDRLSHSSFFHRSRSRHRVRAQDKRLWVPERRTRSS